MSTPTDPLPAPVRLNLTEQCTAWLREKIRLGSWDANLPSEAELCRELGISRGTLRRSLSPLHQEGLIISSGRGRRLKIHSRHHSKPPIKPHGRIIRVLSPQPRLILTAVTQGVFQTMSERIGRFGLNLEFEHHPGLWKLRRPAAFLRKITSQPDTAGWVLYRSTKEVQTWFAQSGLPTIVLGSVYPNIPLSHAEFDLVAASRHAAGVFAARKYKRMAFLLVNKATAGDLASAKAFVDAAHAAGGHADIAFYDDTVPGLCRALDGLMLGSPPPNAFFVAFPNHVPATIGHLQRRGFPVPKSVAVISRMDARLLAESIPTIARYTMDAEMLGRGATRLLRRALAADIQTTTGQSIVMPSFVDGETAGGKSPDWY